MARMVFFSFHYEEDKWRANQVRNSWVTKPDREAAGFWDAASWEEVKRKGEEAIKRWIDKQLEGTSVTVVLIGTETFDRKYVLYEIEKSYERGNGLLGVYIHNLKDQYGNVVKKGDNPFKYRYIPEPDGKKPFLSEIFYPTPTYDYIDDDGYNNLGAWVEKAAKDAGR